MGLSGLQRGQGQHASAVLICHSNINDLIPLQLSSKKKKLLVDMICIPFRSILLKYDILGLKSLDVIRETCKLLNINEKEINVDHESIYSYLQNFKYKYGIFQLETFAQGNAASKIKPKNFEQLADCLEDARPGAFSSIDKYCDYIHNGKYNTVYPLIDDILKPTGVCSCLYQETLLAMCRKLGLDVDDAEGLRKCIGKKLKDKFPEYKEKLYNVCKINNHPIEVVDIVWKIAEDSAGYQFAKAHAIAYAMLTARTLYLKANHPLQYYLSLLKMAYNESDQQNIIFTIQQEMMAQGHKLLPPNLIESSLEFIIEGNDIRFALNSIKGVSEKTIDRLQSFRKIINSDKFQVFQSLKSSGLNIGIGSALIQAGCLEGYDGSRSRLVLELKTWNILTDREKVLLIEIGSKQNWDVLNSIVYLKDNLNEKGKPYIKASRFETIRKKYDKYKNIFKLNSKNEKLANYFYERKVLGYSYSQDLKSLYDEKVDYINNVAEIKAMVPGEFVKIIGFVNEPYKSKTKNKNDCFSFTLIDDTDSITIKSFNQKIQYIRRKITDGWVEEEDLVILDGKLMEGGTIFANNIAIQTVKIYMKLSELKDSDLKKT